MIVLNLSARLSLSKLRESSITVYKYMVPITKQVLLLFYIFVYLLLSLQTIVRHFR